MWPSCCPDGHDSPTALRRLAETGPVSPRMVLVARGLEPLAIHTFTPGGRQLWNIDCSATPASECTRRLGVERGTGRRTAFGEHHDAGIPLPAPARLHGAKSPSV